MIEAGNIYFNKYDNEVIFLLSEKRKVENDTLFIAMSTFTKATCVIWSSEIMYTHFKLVSSLNK